MGVSSVIRQIKDVGLYTLDRGPKRKFDENKVGETQDCRRHFLKLAQQHPSTRCDLFPSQCLFAVFSLTR